MTVGEAFKNRRTLYTLSDKGLAISQSRILDIIRAAVLHTPTPFNCQNGRVVLLVGDEHKKFWDLAGEIALATVGGEVFERAYEPRVKMFRAAYGTVLFYSDPAALKALEAKWPPTVIDKFPDWEQQANGMLHYAVWTMLTAEGLGCSLQHYNPMVDDRVCKEWDIPAGWKLGAQLVFGAPAGPFREKTFEPVEERLFAYGM
ncbi:putative fatty acid repression mutant protein [Podospora didyma]|uniref:Fatty acid repression mutant protein n=1 Tax=Podospora didyma TaxID=330526 RepID=A0AAE0NRT6_9PEZI|nr:putative fatty acid repression mutant protein [Podospora didyma]